MAMDKARVVWKGIKYYDADLKTIIGKECKVLGVKAKNYTVSKQNKCIIVEGITPEGEIKTFSIPLDVLNIYKVGKVSSDFEFIAEDAYGNRKGLSELDIENAGRYVAATWGGNFIFHTIDKKKKRVIFHCIENGQPFDTAMYGYEFFANEYANLGTKLKKKK